MPDAPFLCKIYVGTSPLQVPDGFTIEDLPRQTEYAVYVQSLDDSLLETIQTLWSNLPAIHKVHRAKYSVKSLYTVEDRDRPGMTTWKTRHLAEHSYADIFKDRNDEELSRLRRLKDHNFRIGDLLYIFVQPPTPHTALMSGTANFAIRGAARQDKEAAASSSIPAGDNSWIEARKADPPTRPFGRGGVSKGLMAKQGARGKDRYFDSRSRSKSPERAQRPRRGSPSY